jgi:hypothetical protein
MGAALLDSLRAAGLLAERAMCTLWDARESARAREHLGWFHASAGRWLGCSGRPAAQDATRRRACEVREHRRAFER